MERFLGALSITLLLSGWATVTQFQNPQNSVVQFARAESSQSHSAPAGVIPDRSAFINILAKALQVNRSQVEPSPLDRSQHSQASRQVSGVPSQSMSSFGEIHDDVQTALHKAFMP